MAQITTVNTTVEGPAYSTVITLAGPQGASGGTPAGVLIDTYCAPSIGFACNGATITNGSPIITLQPGVCGSAAFTQAMVGMSVDNTSFPLTGNAYPVIISVQSATQCTVNQNATSTNLEGSVGVFETSRDDTAGMIAAMAAASARNTGLIASSRIYVLAPNATFGAPSITLSGIQFLQGQGDSVTWFISKYPTQAGSILYWPNAPVGGWIDGFTIKGGGMQTPAYLSSMTMVGGQLTATVTNGRVLDAAAPIRLQGARNAAFPLRWTRFVTTGTPTSTGFTASARTWDGRVGYASISNISCAAGVITVTTSATNTFESEEQLYLNSLTTATFLNGQRLGVINTNQGTTSVQLTAPVWYSGAVSISGTTATYTGTFPTGSLAGTTVTFAGFTNAGNNGAFVVTSSTSSQIVVTNASAVNETISGSWATVTLTTYTSHSDTGTVAYLNDGTYTDTMSAVHMYNAFEAWTHPNQLSTILNHFNVSNISAFRVQGDCFTLHGPNYGYADRIEALGGKYGASGGLCLESAYPTTGRYTNPSAFEVRGGCQLYGDCFGFAAQYTGGLSVGMVGINGSGIGIVLDNCSGVSFNGYDLETQTPLTGQTDLWPGNGIEIVGGQGITMGGYQYLGLQDDTTGNSSASQRCFYAWNGATAFTYSNACHLSGAGYTQQTQEIYVDSTCYGYTVENVRLTGTTANVSLNGGKWRSFINGVETISSNSSGGLILNTEYSATSGQNNASPLLTFGSTYWNGTTSATDTMTLQSVPGTGTNPGVVLNLFHSGAPGGSSFNYNNNFTIDGAGDIIQYTSGAATSTSGNGNSPSLTLKSNYWNGSASAVDQWSIQSILGTGTTPNSELLISHSGSSGVAFVEMPNLTITGGLTTNGSATVYGGNLTVSTSGPANIFVTSTGTNPAQVLFNAISSATSASQDYTLNYNPSNHVFGVYDGTAAVWRLQIADTTGVVSIPTNIASTSQTTGTLVVTGGVGVSGAINASTVNASTFTGSLSGNATTATSATTSTTSTTATNIAGGAAGSIPYQTAAGSTSLLATASGVLVGGTTPSYSTSPTLTGTNFSGIPNTALTNSSVTVTAGTGLSGGGAVSLGSSITLTNAGVTSNVAGTDIIVSGATGAVTIGTNSTLATVTGRGATTASAISLTAGTAASSTTTGTLIVTGGVGVSGTIYSNSINTSGMYCGGGITTTSSLTINGALSGVTALGTSGNATFATASVATSGTSYASPIITIQDSYWNGTAGVLGGFTIQSTCPAGANPVETLTFGHSGSTGGSAFSWNGQTAWSGAGTFNKYIGITLAGNGQAVIVAATNATGKTANVTAATLLSAPATGQYRINVSLKVTTAATTSSTLPDCSISWTDADNSTVQTMQLTAGNGGNSLTTKTQAVDVFDALTGTNITFTIGGNQAYASSGATAMQYAYRIRLEYIG